jgi:uncharacterized membrane protein (DUF4010 family)
VRTGDLAPATAWRFILVAAMANLGFKTAMVAALGDRKLLRLVLAGFGLSFLVGAALLLFRS